MRRLTHSHMHQGAMGDLRVVDLPKLTLSLGAKIVYTL